MGFAEYWYDAPLNICPICKKGFAPAPEHAWKIGKYDGVYQAIVTPGDNAWELVCSYTCMRVWEKKQEAKLKKKIESQRIKKLDYKKQQYHKQASNRNLEIKKMADAGCSLDDIAEKFELTRTRICQILKTYKED